MHHKNPQCRWVIIRLYAVNGQNQRVVGGGGGGGGKPDAPPLRPPLAISLGMLSWDIVLIAYPSVYKLTTFSALIYIYLYLTNQI
jgi:hypothetical protein